MKQLKLNPVHAGAEFEMTQWPGRAAPGAPRRRAILKLTAIAVACAAVMNANAADYLVTSESQLRQAILDANADGAPSSTITLGANVTLTNAAVFPTAAKPVTLNIGTFTLSAANSAASTTFPGSITVLNGGTIQGGSPGGKAIAVSAGSRIETSGLIQGGSSTADGGIGIDAGNGTVVINAAGVVRGGNTSSANSLHSAGPGIVGNGAHVIVNGRVESGVKTSNGTLGFAIALTGASVLELHAGYSVVGAVRNLLGGTLILGGSADGTFNAANLGFPGSWGGTTIFKKTGSSTWTLTGTTLSNTSWQLLEGTMRVSSNGALGNAVATLTFDGGTLRNDAAFSSPRAVTINASGGTFQTDADLTWSGVISGTGALNKTGTATLVLAGNNTYGGPTTVSSGTLQVGAAGTAGSLGTGGVVNQGSLVFNRTDTMTVGNAISGTGSLTQAGTGTTILSGVNSYAGTTTISAGTLQVGNGGTTGNFGPGAIVNNGTLAFDRADTVTIGHAISGSGSLVQAGAGTVVLNGANTYAGTTTISAGTLQVGDGGTSGTLGAGAVTNNASLVFNRSDAVTLAGMSGTGSLTQAGGGTLTLTGTHTYSGGTFVNAGTLAVNGTIGGNTTVGNGGRLAGTGTTGMVAVAGGGMLATGNTTGALTVNGDLSFAPGSTFLIRSNAAGASEAVTAVNASSLTLNGGQARLAAGGQPWVRNTAYTLLRSTAGRTGTFDSLASELPLLTPVLAYEPDAVVLTVTANPAGYETVAVTPNEKEVGRHLSTFADSPGAAAALIRQIEGLTAPEARRAFASLAGSQHASASQVATAVGRNFSSILSARTGFAVTGLRQSGALGLQQYASLNPAYMDTMVAQATDAGPGAVALRSRGIDESALEARTAGSLWLQPISAGGHIGDNGNGNGPALGYTGNGFALGYDRPVDGRWLAGGAFGYQRSEWNANIASLPSSPAAGKVHTTQAGLYASYKGDAWRIRMDATLGLHEFDTERTIDVGGGPVQAKSEHRGRELGASVQAEYPIAWGEWQVRPLVGARYARLTESGFSETGPSVGNLSVDRRTAQSLTTSAGARFLLPLYGDKGALELRAVASHLLGDEENEVRARVLGQPGGFTASGSPLKRTALTMGIGVTGQWTRTLWGYADAAYEYRGSGQNAWQVAVGLRKLF